MILRKYQPSDMQQITELFYNTVHCVNVKDYTKDQLDVWATGDVDTKSWNASFLLHNTLIAEEHQCIIGFADMDKGGYLDRLYVHKDYQGMGVATQLCDALETQSTVKHFTTHASITARPFFERRGYHVVKAQQVQRGGILLTNYVMEKSPDQRN